MIRKTIIVLLALASLASAGAWAISFTLFEQDQSIGQRTRRDVDVFGTTGGALLRTLPLYGRVSRLGLRWFRYVDENTWIRTNLVGGRIALLILSAGEVATPRPQVLRASVAWRTLQPGGTSVRTPTRLLGCAIGTVSTPTPDATIRESLLTVPVLAPCFLFAVYPAIAFVRTPRRRGMVVLLMALALLGLEAFMSPTSRAECFALAPLLVGLAGVAASKPQPRLRKVLRWAGLSLAIVVGCLWMTSIWYGIVYAGSGWILGITQGCFVTNADAAPNTLPWSGLMTQDQAGWPIRWWFWGSNTGLTPIWAVLLSIAIPTFLLWSRPAIPPGHCRKCGYDLTGNESGVCPECGTEIAPPRSAERSSC